MASLNIAVLLALVAVASVSAISYGGGISPLFSGYGIGIGGYPGIGVGYAGIGFGYPGIGGLYGIGALYGYGGMPGYGFGYGGYGISPYGYGKFGKFY